MKTTTASSPKEILATPVLTFTAWAMMFVASTFPIVLWHFFVPSTLLWLHGLRVAILLIGLAATLKFPVLKPLRSFLFVLLLMMMIGWDLLVPRLMSQLSAHTLFLKNSFQAWAPGIYLLVFNLIRLTPTFLVLLFLIGKKLRREDLFITKGHLQTPVSLSRFLPRPLSWFHLGIIFLLLAGLVLPAYLFITVHPNTHRLAVLVLNAPFILLCAALNATNEEFEYRCVLLTRLLPAVGQTQALWITTLQFGLWHYYGNPSGPIGVILAGIAGFFWGLGMLETRGMRWTWVTHCVQDVVIFSFLVTVL